jgi:uncharacterized membrane protein HdeD (DUF308 family)
MTTTLDEAAGGLQQLLERRWWLVALRGAAGIAFGIICFVQPLVAALSILFLFAFFAIVDGALGLASAVGQARKGERWVWLAVEGVASLLLGIFMLAMPAAGALFLWLLIALKALLAGVFLLVSAFRLDAEHGRGWLIGAGLLSLAFAALLLLAPAAGLKAVIWWVGAWSLLFGALLLALGFRLRKAAKQLGQLRQA